MGLAVSAAAVTAIVIYYLISHAQVREFITDLDPLIYEKASLYGLEGPLVKAVAKVESNFNPSARNYEKSPEDYDDSFGLMQVSLMLAQDYGYVKDYRHPTQAEISSVMKVGNNLDIACPHLKYLLSNYFFDVAIQMYNVGETGYRQGKRNSNYLKKVSDYYGIYKQT